MRPAQTPRLPRPQWHSARPASCKASSISRATTSVKRIVLACSCLILLDLIRAGQIKKGDVLTVAQIAGITASKRTSDLIPLCHPLPLTKVDVDLTLDNSLPGVVITATVKTVGKTGVEMEALVGCSVAALTVYDMCKAVSHDITICDTRLVYKDGGQRHVDKR